HELVHLLEAALVEQVDDQLELVHALEVRNLGLIAGLDESLKAAHHELRRAYRRYRGRRRGRALAPYRWHPARPPTGRARRGLARTDGERDHRDLSARSVRRRGRRGAESAGSEC